jgi:hypothetical protein
VQRDGNSLRYLARRRRDKIFLHPPTRRDSGLLRAQATFCGHLRCVHKTCLAPSYREDSFSITSIIFRCNLFLILKNAIYSFLHYFFHGTNYSNLLTCSMHDPLYCRLTKQWRTDLVGQILCMHENPKECRRRLYPDLQHRQDGHNHCVMHQLLLRYMDPFSIDRRSPTSVRTACSKINGSYTRETGNTSSPFFPSILIKSAGYISILLTDVNSCFDVLDRHESCPFCKFRMAAR